MTTEHDDDNDDNCHAARCADPADWRNCAEGTPPVRASAGRGWIPASRDIGLPGDEYAEARGLLEGDLADGLCGEGAVGLPTKSALRQAQDERGAEAAPDERGALAQASPQARHGLDAQIRFLEALALSGNVRAACGASGISPQTAYRWRHKGGAFVDGWEAALVAARSVVEQVLADRALNGVQEAVFYHGEEVARRQRFDARLLLAHMARLDAKAADGALAQAGEGFADTLERLAAGERVLLPVAEPEEEVPALEAYLRELEAQGIADLPPENADYGFKLPR